MAPSIQAQSMAGPAEPAIPLATIRQAGLRDFQVTGEKFLALADAFPEALYDFRPRAGVRSVREVFQLIVAENFGMIVPVPFLTPPAEFADGAAGLARLRAMAGKAELTGQLRASLAALQAGLDRFPADQAMAIPFFDGPPRPLSGIISAIAGDQHEHLGQLIAYARMNGITPPWSKP